MSTLTLRFGDTTANIDTEGVCITQLLHDETNILFPAQKIADKLRGGIPVCAPIFGPGDIVGLAQHGFARDVEWVVTRHKSDEATLSFEVSKYSEVPSPYQGCYMKYTVKIRENSLFTELTIENHGKIAFVCSPGFHPYFATSDAARVSVMADREYQFGAEQLAATQFLPPRQSQVRVELSRATVTLASDTLQRYAVWSANPDKYICVEPTWAGNLADQPAPLLIEPGGVRKFNMSLTWKSV